ncbi:MAG: hypothetical protein ACXVHB_10590 [Solirubrobacteraceae bacterium]
MALTEHVAIVSIAREVPTRDLMQVAAAVQKQVTRDFSPLWGIAATVDAFEDLASVPSDYRPVVLFGDLAELSGQLESRIGEREAQAVVDVLESDDIAGIHLAAITRQPFSLASVSGAWTVTVSHETLEMLADPYGNRLVAAVHPLNRAKRVNYLLEVCDPCLATYYTVNGLPVSDFYTPRYFDPVRTDSVRYSFTGAIEAPLEILPGGYLSWIDPLDSALYQLEAGGQPIRLRSQAELAASRTSLRTVVDSDPRTPRAGVPPLRQAASATASERANIGVKEASESTAQRIEDAIITLKGGLG